VRENVIVVDRFETAYQKVECCHQVLYRGGAVCERGTEPLSSRQSEQLSASHGMLGFYVVSN
jgi:hypothetical protein